MQDVLTLATNSIALFGAAYFLTALTAHLWHCWQHPPAKAAPIATVEEFDLAEIIDPYGLLADSTPIALLLPASESHPWELAVERMPEVEPIAAVRQPAAAVEPSADALDVGELLEAIDIEPPSDYALMTIRELKRIASDRKIPGYSKRTKAELIELLTV
ncbi:Rho termination factor N-terminal domain-containing protein [Microcoleus sp. FACHB-1515]|uniref:Rho termination factor N-terminal domain-containing protein n=1 Tax=Cyanophyceae TaxID=3028117 RepID=UPI001687E54B|nr:Rho termination factor N-terminal domain-containing protein [Microcoleus sp. FACHB-1515]MBD2089243.1 Rho termination factor N-terminal domain-containing protein [Microcoleus sp. FACHB-1515]